MAARGLQVPQAKLNEKLVKRIRAQHRKKQRLIRKINDRYSIRGFAAKYQVGYECIVKVLLRRTWKHVT